MLSVAGVALGISLGVGTWRFSSTEAPAMVWPAGPILTALLLLELAYCVIGVFLLATRAHPETALKNVKGGKMRLPDPINLRPR
jgi:hypothetical protein